MYIMCPGGSRCISVAGSNYACRKAHYVKQGDECTYDFECIGSLNCRSTNNSPYPTCQWNQQLQNCPGSSKNCSTILGERCICGQDGQPNTCKRVSSDLVGAGCDYQKSYLEWRDCWARNNCPYDNQMNYLAFFIYSFSNAGTCMAKNCGHIAKNYLCCSSYGFNFISYSDSNNLPMNCDSNIFATVTISLLFVVVAASMVTTFIVVLIIYLKNRKKSEPFEQLP